MKNWFEKISVTESCASVVRKLREGFREKGLPRREGSPQQGAGAGGDFPLLTIIF